MTKLAKRFRLSDVELRIICPKHGIPTPPLGYWARLHGKKVTQPALPRIKPGQSERVDLTPVATEKLSDEGAEELRQALEREAGAGPKITVPNERPRRLHPVAEEAEKTLREAREDHYGFRKFLSDWNPPLYLAKTSIGRAIRILDTIAKEVVDRGGTVLEDKLNDIFLALVPAAAIGRQRRLEKEAAEREAERKAELARQEAARKERAKHREKFVVELAEDYARYCRLADFANVFDTLAAGGGNTQAGRMAGTLRTLVEEAARRFTIEQLSSEIEKKKLFGEGD